MVPAVHSLAARYGVAAGTVAVALVVRLLLDPVIGDRLPFLAFAMAIVAVAWHGGFGPSLLALLLAIPTTAFFFLPPRYDLGASMMNHQVQVFGFLFLGLSIGLFSERLRAARRRAEAHAWEADRRREELEKEVARRGELERQLQRRAEELADADRRKDEFLAMLAHELRNPLAPIRNAALVIRSLASTDPDLRRSGEMIERQVGHLARLVDDLLDVSRITRGKVEIQKKGLDLLLVVHRAVETCRPLLEARKHDLAVVVPRDPVWVEGDATRLGQILANLLNNAAKYTPDGGHLQVSVEEVPGQVILRVKDDGVGIPADLLPNVFDLFAQGDRSLARSEGGLGIGLTLVKSLAEMHGGVVEARSKGPGKGSEFVVRLPAMPMHCRPQLTPCPPTQGKSGKSGRRVLAVDDNVDAVASLALLLGMQGHEVRIAHDGPAALEQAEAFRPEVIILDIGLPRMDGYEVARRLREREASRDVFLVALTGYGQEQDRLRSSAAGFDHHLVKPVDPNIIRDLLVSSQ